MTPVEYIRTQVFGMTQAALANVLNTTQASISRWESQGYFPPEAQSKVREMARAKGLGWSDSWFFEVPKPEKIAS